MSDQTLSDDLKAMDPVAQLRAILNNTQQSFVLIDPAYVIQAFNQPAARNAHAVFGWSMQQGRSILDFVRPADMEGFTRHFQQALEGDIVTVEKVLSGDRWFALTYNPIRADTGEVTGVCFNSVDITARKRAEEALAARTRALEESQAELTALIDNAPFAMMVVDRAWRVQKITDRGGEFVKEPSHHILGLRCGEALCCVHADDMPDGCGCGPDCQGCPLRSTALDTIETGRRHYGVEAAMDFAYQGEVYEKTVLIYATPLEVAGERHALVILQDITGRKRVEEALRIKDNAIATSINAVAMADLEGRLTYVNDAFLQLWGYDGEEEVLGRPVIDFWQSPGQAADVVAMLRTSGGWRGELTAVKKGGALADVELSASLVNDERGNPIRMMASFVDITDRKRAEEALRRTTERLRIEREIATAILAAQSPEAIARAALTRLYQLIPCQHASIVELDLAQGGGRDLIILEHGEVQAKDPGWRMLSDVGSHLRVAMQHGYPHVIQDMALLETRSPLEHDLIAHGLCAYVSVPLVVGDTPVGTLNIASATPNFFQPEHLEILEEVAASLAVALQQARLLEQTQQDAATKALLLHEVNHRVKNNLDAIIGLLYVERRHAPPEVRDVFQPIVDDLTQRIMGLAQVHRMLSAAEWQPLVLSELTQRLIDVATQTLPRDLCVGVDVAPSPVRVPPAQAHHLALVISELTTNTLKYAVTERDVVRVSVQIAQEDDVITLTYRNDGPDYPEEVLRLERHNAGLDIVQNIVRRNLRGELALRNENGAVTEIRFKAEDGL